MNFTATRRPGTGEPYIASQNWQRGRQPQDDGWSEIPLRLSPEEEAELARYRELRAAGLWPPRDKP